MSIVAYVGLPGSGKSYGVVENVILPALEAGRHIITNIPLKLGRLSDDYPKGRITTFENAEAENDPGFFSLDRHPAGVIWVIDEAWRFWKSGMKSTNIPQNQKEFFTEHRHCVGDDGLTNEIVLVTQDLSQLCQFVRSLVEETYRAVKMTAVGQKNRYRVDVHMGAATGQKPGKPMRQLYGKYKPDIYQYYKSHTRNKTDFAAGMEEKADDRANVLKHPLIRFGVPIAVVVMIVAAMKVYAYFNPESRQTQPVEGVSPASSTGEPLRSAGPVRASRDAIASALPARASYQSQFEIEPGWLPVSDKWRLVGEVNGVYWIWGENGTRKIHSRVCARFQRTGEPYCVIQGKLVTYYSYKAPEREYRRAESRSWLESSSEDTSDGA